MSLAGWLYTCHSSRTHYGCQPLPAQRLAVLPLLAAHLGSALPPPPLPLAGPFKSQSLFAHPCRLANLAVTNLAVINPIAKLAVTNLTATSLNVTGGARVGGTLTADSITARLITATSALASRNTLGVTGLSSLYSTTVGTAARKATFTVNGNSILSGAVTGGAAKLNSLKVLGESSLGKVRRAAHVANALGAAEQRWGRVCLHACGCDMGCSHP